MRHAVLIGLLIASISFVEFHLGYDDGLKHQQSVSDALDKLEVKHENIHHFPTFSNDFCFTVAPSKSE